MRGVASQVGPYARSTPSGPFSGDDSRHVPRDLFPLPLVTAKEVPSDLKAGRKVRRRLEKAFHVDQMVNGCIKSLNSLYSGGRVDSAKSCSSGISLAQQMAVKHITNSVHQLGAPPDLTGAEALRQLRAFDGYGDDQAPCAVKPYDSTLLSLPEHGSKAVPLHRLLGEDGMEIVGEFIHSRLLDEGEAHRNLVGCGLRQCYSDPRLRIPSVYREFVSRLASADVVEFSLEAPRERIEMFFVGKKDGRLRMVADCRRSNCWFSSPDRVKLCTAEALSRISLDPGGHLSISTADLKDAFYHFELPLQLRGYFGMRPLRAGDVSLDFLDGKFLSASDLIYPRLKVLPMGWTHALWWCQTIHQRIVSSIGADHTNLLEDKSSVPSGDCMHLEYVDNFVVLGTSQSKVESLAAAGVRKLRESGLVVHEVEHSSGSIKVLGWEFEDTVMKPKPARVWRIVIAMQRLLQTGIASGRQLEKVIGHATFIGLGRREVLSVFGDTYTFIHRKYHVASRIWRSVRRELEIFCGLCPLLWRDLALPWDTEVTAIDASTWGLGATTSQFSIDEVSEYGRFSERWRFEHESFSKLRSSAFGVDVAGEDEGFSAAVWAVGDSSHKSQQPPIRVVPGKPLHEVFQQLPFAAVDRNWQVVGRHKWKKIEAIPVLEARASLYSVKHALRSVSGFHRRHLVLSDSISAVCALDRGRGKSFRMRRVTQQVCALTLASNTVFSYRWLPSEWNPADGPSRGSFFPARVQQCPSHDSSFDPSWGIPPGVGINKEETKSALEEISLANQRQQGQKAGEKNSVERGGQPERGVCGNQLQETLSGCLEEVERFQSCSPGCSYSSGCCGRGGGRTSESHVFGGGGSKPRAVHDGCSSLLPPPPQESQTGEHACCQTIFARVAETGPTEISIASALGSYLFHGAASPPTGEEVRRIDDALLLCTLPPSGGSSTAESSRSSDSCAQCRPIFSKLVSGSTSVGGRYPIQDCRIRRDSDVRPPPSAVHTDSGNAAVEVAEQAPDSTNFFFNHDPTSRGDGSNCQGERVGVSGPTTSLQAKTWRGEPRLPSQASSVDGNSTQRQVEVTKQCPSIRKGRKDSSVVAKSRSANVKQSVGRNQRYSKNRPEPALKPERAWTVPVFLEIFSGSGHLSISVARITGWITLLWDITLGPEYDLRSAANRRRIAGWMRSGWIVGFHLGTPCNSFTRARDVPPGPPPLRSDQQPLGLSDLRPCDQIKVIDGNCFMRFSAYMLRLGLRLVIPGSMENPQRSRMWLCPPLQYIIRHSHSHWQITHYCAWGKPYKKATVFLSVHVQLHRLEAGVCKSTKRGICQHSQKPHAQLVGQDAQGNWLTRLAQPYPQNMCDAIAKDYKDFEVARIASRFESYFGK